MASFITLIFPVTQLVCHRLSLINSVAYSDGTVASKEQIALDIATFLNWTAEPELDARKSLGLKVVLYLVILTILLYALKRQIWKDVNH